MADETTAAPDETTAGDENGDEDESDESDEEEGEAGPPATEFPSDWHQERYAEDLAREIAGYERRRDELKAAGVGKDSPGMADAMAGLSAARSELERLGGGQETAAKRPRGRPRKSSG